MRARARNVLLARAREVWIGLNGKWFARDRSLYKEAEEQWETAGAMIGKSIIENDKHI